MRVRILAACGSAVLLSAFAPAAFAVDDVGFSTTPTRNLTDTASTPINASVNNQGSGIGDLTPNTTSFGQGLHWVGRPENHPFDEEITTAAAHTGTQSWRVSNYYASGIVPTDSTPWLNQSAGETGSQDRPGHVATSHVFNAVMYFRSVATSDPSPGTLQNPHTAPGQWTQESFGADNGGARWGGVMVARDRYTGNNGATFGSGVQLAWDNESTVTGSHLIYSPQLAYGDWYKIVMQETFNDGKNGDGSANDVVNVQVFDSSNNLVWSPTGLTSWEASGFYGPNPTPVAQNSFQWRLSSNADDPNANLTGDYSTFKPAGFYWDDISISTGAGAAYSTSFEPAPVPEPAIGSIVLLGGALVTLRRRSRNA